MVIQWNAFNVLPCIGWLGHCRSRHHPFHCSGRRDVGERGECVFMPRWEVISKLPGRSRFLSNGVFPRWLLANVKYPMHRSKGRARLHHISP